MKRFLSRSTTAAKFWNLSTQAVKVSGNQNRLRDLQDKIDMAPYRKTQTKLGIEHKVKRN